ncbi:unnamed protein product [Albugo candida]|uniref:Uncharacterized protein n=1 Tax=Albugo candida TaxID=65357 RepID=A0A024G1Y4_9STRA|nr:unnamed protein product [Albugo candida]|eukprot:CCI40780.1 unnamed protein product [Albugo candida]
MGAALLKNPQLAFDVCMVGKSTSFLKMLPAGTQSSQSFLLYQCLFLPTKECFLSPRKVSFHVSILYLKVAADTDNVFQIRNTLLHECFQRKAMKTTKNINQLFALWCLQKYYQQRQMEFQNKAETCASHTVASQSCGVRMDQRQYNGSFIYRQNLYCHTCGI